MLDDLWFSPDSSHLLTKTNPTPGDLLTSYSIKPTTNPPVVSPIKNGMAWWVEFIPHSQRICIYEYDQSIQILDAANLSLLHKFAMRSNTRQYPNSSSPGFFSPDASRLVTIPQNGTGRIEIFSGVNYQMTSTIQDLWHGLTGYFSDAVFLNDSSHLLTDTDKGVAHTWKLRRPENVLGLTSLPQFWLMALSTLMLLLSAAHDLRRFWLG